MTAMIFFFLSPAFLPTIWCIFIQTLHNAFVRRLAVLVLGLGVKAA